MDCGKYILGTSCVQDKTQTLRTKIMFSDPILIVTMLITEVKNYREMNKVFKAVYQHY